MNVKVSAAAFSIVLAVLLAGCADTQNSQPELSTAPGGERAVQDDVVRGARSLIVNVANESNADFTIQAAETVGQSVWINGDKPEQGQVLAIYEELLVGVMTDDDDAPVGGSVVLTGLGEPISLQMMMDPEGEASVECGAQACRSVQMETGDADHAQFNVTVAKH